MSIAEAFAWAAAVYFGIGLASFLNGLIVACSDGGWRYLTAGDVVRMFLRHVLLWPRAFF